MPLLSSRTRSGALLALASSAAVLGATLTAAGAAAAETAPAAEVAAGCPKERPGQFAFTSTLTNGTINLGSSATITGSSSTACGLLGVRPSDGKFAATIAKDDITFAPVETKVGLLSFPTTFRATSRLTGPVGFTATGQSARLTGNVVATAEIFGQKCDIPLKLTLTTSKSGSVKGRDLRADASGRLTGRLVSGTFAVPEIQASDSCNLLIAGSSNALLGLPLEKGESTISYDAVLKVGT